MVYAPDNTEAGTFEKRLSVRPKHAELMKVQQADGLARTLVDQPVPPAAHLFRGIRCRWISVKPRISGTRSRTENGRKFVDLRS